MVEFQPIGIIHSPFKELKGMPIQPRSAKGNKGQIEIYKEYQDGLKDLEGFSHIILIYHLHKSDHFNLQVIPFLDTEKRGVFATRAPRRPNPIGLSVVELIDVSNNILNIQNIDILDNTPLLDIKPYVPEFDNTEKISIGWLEKARKEMDSKLSDDRFHKD
jgi:tRNA (adenine37-N6)-methyltransferase